MINYRAGLVAVMLVAAACGTSGNPVTPTPETAETGRCQIREQFRDLNNLIRRAAEDASLDAGLARRAAEIEALASEAGGGAAGQRDAVREASCRAISLRAYGALLRVPERQEAALSGIERQAVDGDLACSAIGQGDAGSRMDCSEIRLWRYTVDAVRATQSLRDIRNGIGAPGASVETEVPEETWVRIGERVTTVQNSIANNWQNAPGGAEHKTRVACDFYGVMVGMRTLPSPAGSEGRRRVFAEAFPSTMLAAANALSIPPPSTPACQAGPGAECDVERVNELQRVCVRLSGT